MNDDREKELNKLIALRIEKLREAKYSYDDLLIIAANYRVMVDLLGNTPIETKISLSLSDVCTKIIPNVVSKAVCATKSNSGKHAAEMRHATPGGSRDMSDELLAKWASGQFDTRDRCAYEWYEDFQMTEKTARRKLQGTPDPNPWPAKKAKK